MRIAVAGNRAAAGIVVADINLKLIWDIIAAIKIGDTGHALVVDDSGRLIAHPDISLVLRSGAGAEDFDRLKSVVSAANGSAVATTGEDGKPVVALSVRAANVGWTVIAEQPVLEAFESIRAALWRSLILIGLGIVFALVLGLLAGVPHVGADPATRGRRRTDRDGTVRPSHRDQEPRRTGAIG